MRLHLRTKRVLALFRNPSPYDSISLFLSRLTQLYLINTLPLLLNILPPFLIPTIEVFRRVYDSRPDERLVSHSTIDTTNGLRRVMMSKELVHDLAFVSDLQYIFRHR